MSIADIDYREYFLPEVVEELRKAFVYYDADEDGQISIKELYAMFRKLGKTLGRAQLQEVFREIDTDESGYIDFEEFCLLEIKMSGARPRADLIRYEDFLTERQISRLEMAFVHCDGGGTGLISTESLRTIVDKYGPWNQKTAMERKPTPEDFEDVLAEVDPEAMDQLDFPSVCCAFAMLIKARKLINYREFLKPDEVESYRTLFAQGDKTGSRSLSRIELDRLLKRMGLVLGKPQLKTLFADFDGDGSGDIDFEEFCVMILRLRGVRKYRDINPETCTCEQLWKEEGFNVKELQQSGFSLADFRRVGINVGQVFKDGGFTGLELRRAGYSAKELKKCGVGLAEMRSAGYSLTDLRLAGYSSQALEGINRQLHGSLSVGDLSVLPQRCPKPALSQGIVLSSAGFQLLKDVSRKSQPMLPRKVAPARQMTPMIREHTDWKPQLAKKSAWLTWATTDDQDSLDPLLEEPMQEMAGSRYRPSDSNGFLLDEYGKFRKPE